MGLAPQEKYFYCAIAYGIYFLKYRRFFLFIGVGFYLLGALLVLPFSSLEVTVLLVAYFYNTFMQPIMKN